MLPMKNNGAALIYNNIIGPFVRKHEGKIDDVVSMTEALAREGGKEREYKFDGSSIVESCCCSMN